MIKNNKGVTLVELLIVIVVMGLIAAFSIPAVGQIIENTNKDAVLNDALQVENAAKTYCNTVSTCVAGTTTLSWDNVDEYVSGITESNYVFGATPATTVATYESDGSWHVIMETTAAQSWEFDDADAGVTPSQTDRSSITADTD